MKIGFSLGRCIRDIVNGDVNYNDVAYIIAATAIRDEEQLKHVIDDYLYRRDYLEGLDEAACQKIAADLYNSGKVLQPRMHFGQTCSQPTTQKMKVQNVHGITIV